MGIWIDKAACVGCGRCTESCPGSLIELTDGKADIVYPRDCWGCASCVKECPVGAIALQPAADVGGDGSRMYVKVHADRMDWHIVKKDGEETVIAVNRRDANQY